MQKETDFAADQYAYPEVTAEALFPAMNLALKLCIECLEQPHLGYEGGLFLDELRRLVAIARGVETYNGAFPLMGGEQ